MKLMKKRGGKVVRNAVTGDIPRLAEILIFAKRVAYRPIFQNDFVSFNEMQVLSLAAELQKKGALDNIAVYDDGIVKGMMNRKMTRNSRSLELCELYVDPFFQHSGIGSRMMESLFAEAESLLAEEIFLWVLEKNKSARSFYEKYGFVYDGNKKPETGTKEYVLRYIKRMK